METRRLRYLRELDRLGSMRAVAADLGVTTSTVSQQIAALAREVGVPLLEPVGRGVRLTAAGRRLADSAVGILAAVDGALSDIDARAGTRGVVRVAGFATAIRRDLLPAAGALADRHPGVRLRIAEHEPAEALALLASHDVDLALVYDYDLAPAPADPATTAVPLWTAPWGLAVPAGTATPVDSGPAPDAVEVFRRHGDRPWIGNSRNTADEQVIGTVCSMAGVEPVIAHRADSLELVLDLVLAGLGIGLLPAEWPVPAGIALLPLRSPDVRLRARAVTVRGNRWPPLTVVLDLLAQTSGGPRARLGQRPQARG
ncbi:LysR family transcriptional regulator [Nakamurella endophytica]|uniref:LysR family transcriptional regulator n=1 Tax=Nakamurella endophytica TaxID=1748367 RepID=UPI001663C0CA|nr:LysR family transcriptional regulator [Nakamurella endophytica]